MRASPFFLLIFLGLSGWAQAATFIVNTTNDPPPVAAPNGCNTSGSCSLREAVLAANASNEPNTILLGEGTYNLTIPEANSPESGDLDFTGSSGNYTVTLQGAGQDKTFIDADPGLNERVLDFSGGNTITVTISDLTIQNGNSPGSGGGVFVNASNSTITLQNVTFSGNKSASTGGGLATNSGTSVTSLQNVNFSSNQAGALGGGFDHESGNPTLIIDGGSYSNNQAETDGGGLYLNGGGSNSTAFSVQNISVTQNKALNGNGGGIFQGSVHRLEINNVQVTSNSAANPGNADNKGQGGGIYTSNGAPLLNGVVQNSVIEGNTADGEPFSNSAGGGLWVSGGGLFRIENCSVDNNQALNGHSGGGLYVNNGGGIQITGSTFSGNSAGGGGGLDINGASSSTKEVTNSTISGNHADDSGGGLSVNRADGLSLNNVTVTLNTASGDGAGINNKNFANPLTIQNSIFAANSTNNDAHPTDDCAGTSYHSLGFNIFASSNNVGCTTDGVSPGTAPNDSTSDPLLGPLADNGGPTQTHALLAGSPAIDGGNPNGCTDGSGALLATDQRGVARPQGAACDIGSYEAASCVNVVCTPTPCHSASCNPQTGQCEFTPLADGTSCDDGNACTTNDACSGGACVGGAPPNCDDSNACTTDSCNPASGCTHDDNSNSCNDGNACTTGDVCSNGGCVGGAPLNCDDGNACTDDTCDPVTGCQHGLTSACDDNNPCTIDSCQVKKNGSPMCKHKKIKGCH